MKNRLKIALQVVYFEKNCWEWDMDWREREMNNGVLMGAIIVAWFDVGASLRELLSRLSEIFNWFFSSAVHFLW
jgi:hypothetical protein